MVPSKLSPCLLIVGFLITLSSAANTCNTSTVNETEICTTKTTLDFMDLCKLTFKQYVCASASDLSMLPENFVVALSSCYTNNTVLALDPGLLSLLFSKLDSNKVKRILAIMDTSSSTMSAEWKAFLMNGIQSLTLQDLNAKNSSSWVEPFYILANATLIQCLESQNATCEIFQKLVKGLGQNYNSMPVSKRQELYPAIKTFLSNQKNKTGSGCAVNVSAGTWVMQNFGSFSQMAALNDFSALYSNFSALDVLPLLTLSQLANFCVDPSLVNKTGAYGLIVWTLKNKSDVSGFLTNLNAIVGAKNQTSLPPALSQVLLNRTFQIIATNLTSYNNTEWTQLFQNQLSLVLPEVTADQLSAVNQLNISCPFFQAVVKGLSDQFPRLNPDKQQQVYKSLIKPYLTQKGSACAANVNSSTWISQNLGNFSQMPTFSEITTFNSNFSALDALTSLTLQQVAGFAVNSGVGNTAASSIIVVGTLKNKTDVFNFMTYLNDALSTGNQNSLSPALSQALFNKTFQVLGNDTSAFNSSDWSQLLTNQLNITLTQVTADQLSLIPQNINCDSYHAVIQAFNTQSPSMTVKTKQQFYTSFIKPYLSKKGSGCAVNVSTGTWVVQNFGSFSQMAELNDFSALNPNFTALEVLPLLTISQLANASVDPSLVNKTDAFGLIVGTLKNKSDVYGFLTNLNATIGAKNQTSLPPALSQALLNKTFQLLAANLTSFNNTEWSQLFQNQLSLVLPEVTADQLSIVPPNISCPFFQAVVKGLSDQFPKLKPDKQQQIYKSLIKPYLTQKGSGCAEHVHSSTWISQNLGSFSPIPTFAEITTFNSNFSALDALSSLTLQQVASFAVNSDVGNSSASSSIIMGTLQNKTDVLNFMTYLNDALTSKNQTSLPPALSQAFLNTTFQILAANLTSFNNTEWSQLFQSQLSFALPEITSNQLSAIPQNISCPFFQAIIKDLSEQFPKLTKDKQQQIFKSLIKPFLTQKGSACAANVNSSTWISQNLGNFSQIPTFAELNTLNANFNALDAIPSLTLQQVAGFAVNSGAVNTAASSNVVLGTLKSKTDVYNFITYLNDALSTGNQNSLSPALSQALFNKTFQVIGNNISAFSSSDWSQLLTKQLNITLTQVTADQLSLIPQNITCDSYHAVIQAFTAQLQNMTVTTQKQVYSSFIKPYLTQKGGKITCYNQTEANSSAWFVTNMGSFFTHTSDTDLGSFANESMQQLFASDPASMQLASQLDLGKDNAMYYTSLLTSSSSFTLSSLPDKFLCSLSPSAIKNLNSNAAIGLIKKINKQCHNPSSGSAAPAPTPEEIEVAVALVSKLENISSSSLNDLGASAVGLSLTQIDSISDSDLVASLSSLSNVTGWNKGQSRAIVKKLINGKFKVENLESLGSLVSGLPSSKLQELSSTQVSNALKNPQFVNQLSSAPSCLKSVLASKLVENYNTPSTLVKNVPSSLASFIPKSSLNYKSEKPVIQDLNEKAWTSDQAAMFFEQVAASETNFTQFSSSVLQGFTCSTPSKLNDSQMKSLAKAMLTQNTLLEEQQLNCLSRQVIKSGIPTDLDKYPKEILWFISSSNYTMGGCVDYFTVVGQSNISILNKGSELRSSLLTQALTCMNVTNTSLTDNHVKVLGQLACDLNATYIENGPSSLLTQLSQCGTFSTVQQNSIATVIAKGNTVYGQPSKWSKETMTSLGSLNGCLGKSALNGIPKGALQSWMKDAIQNSKLSRKQFASIVSNLTPTRRRRAAGCDAGNEITATNVKNVLLPLLYSVDQLDACLTSSVLVAYLPDLSLMPFTDEQLAVMKKKLDQAFPNGYPESVIPDLGAISFLCNESDIAKWNISSVDTLEGLITPGPSDNMAKLYISKYVDSAKSINGPALNVIGSQYICLLTSAQLNLITATAISDAKPLSISNCNQTVKSALYLKANTSFQSTASQPLAYYNLIKPYLGGAPAADLKNLATKNVSMDIGTFIGLNPEAVKSLSVDDVKSLLGTNVVDLKANQNNSVVSAWIKLQTQSDLDKLGIGLQGGIRDVSQTSTVSTISSTTMTTRTSSAPPRSTVLGYSVFFCVVMAVLLS